MTNLWSWLTANLFVPVAKGAAAFWTEVLAPAGASIERWATAHAHWAYDWMEFCFKIFKLKFSIRVASYALMIPIAILAIVFGVAGGRRRKRRGRRS